MKKYLELLENGIMSETWLTIPNELEDYENDVLNALVKNGQEDCGDAGSLNYELNTYQLIEAASLNCGEELTIEEIAEALKGLEEKKYIDIDFESGLVMLRVKFQTEI